MQEMNGPDHPGAFQKKIINPISRITTRHSYSNIELQSSTYDQVKTTSTGGFPQKVI